MAFTVSNYSLKKGNEYTIDISSDQLDQLLGYQMTLEYPADMIEVLDILPGELPGMGNDNFGLNKSSRGVLAVNWFTPNPIQSKSKTIVFSLRLKANADIEAKDLFSIGNAPILDRVYKETNDGIKEFSVDLNFDTEVTNPSNDTFIVSNAPNPFKEQTTISFELSEENEVALSIIDLNGRIVSQQVGNFSKGMNAITIDGSTLSETGIYYYQIKTQQYTITKKMIFVD